MEGVQWPAQVKIPEIPSASARALLTGSLEDQLGKIQEWMKQKRVVAKEKMDGTNFVVYRTTSHELLFFNKGKRVFRDNSVFERTCDALQKRAHLFREGYIYYGEGFRNARATHIHYGRCPRFHWICYDIMIPEDASFRIATPEEMKDILGDTGLEQAQIYFDSRHDGPEKLLEVFSNLERLPSCLGQFAEGVVLTIGTARRKYVASHMRERKTIEGVYAPDCTVQSIGDMFNVQARFRKTEQRLRERGIEHPTRAQIEEELDADLIKEHKEEIVQVHLNNRFWNEMRKAARVSMRAILFDGVGPRSRLNDLRAAANAAVRGQVIDEICAPYNTEERFRRALERRGPDATAEAVANELDAELELEKDALLEQLWQRLRQEICQAARVDL
jgi:hypothetical protein